MMQARVRLIGGWYKTDNTTAAEEAGAPPPGYGPNKRVDFAFVPRRMTELVASSTEGSTATTLTITRLQLVSVPPPAPIDKKDQPPRARTPMPRTRTPAPARGSSVGPDNRYPGSRGKDNSRDNSNRDKKDTMVVSTKEWNSMKQQLNTMVKQHKELMQLLQGTLSKDGNNSSGSNNQQQS
jgi:hypothetical protein